MKIKIILAVLLNTLIIASSSFAEDRQVSIVQADVTRCMGAVNTQDVETTIKCTYPKLIGVMGGETKAKDSITKLYATLKEGGFKSISIKFPAPPTFFGDNDNDYCIVPTLAVTEVGNKKIEAQGFQLGVRVKGSSMWTYLDGTKLTIDRAKELFPNFPPEVIFPPKHQKEL